MENKPMTVDKEEILDNIPLDEEEHRKFFTKKEVYAAMDEYLKQGAASLLKENEELKERFEKSFNLAKIRRKEIDKLILEQGELIVSNEAKEKGIESLKRLHSNNEFHSMLNDKNKEIERLKGLLDDIAKGEKMIVNRTGVGEYTVVFTGGEDMARKYYEDNDFENNL